MRFRAEQHLRKQNDFQAVRSGGRKVDCGSFTLWWLARPNSDGGAQTADAGVKRVRAGFVASTASVGGAVQRNRAKRRLREVFRRNQGLVPGGCDVLLVARRPVTTVGFGELETRFSQACRKIGGIPS